MSARNRARGPNGRYGDPTADDAIANVTRQPLAAADADARRRRCLDRGDFRGAELFRRGARLDAQSSTVDVS